MSKLVSGDKGGKYLVATNGLRLEIVNEIRMEWATLHWFLADDPNYRADWNRLKGYHFTAPNKLSKSDA